MYSQLLVDQKWCTFAGGLHFKVTVTMNLTKGQILVALKLWNRLNFRRTGWSRPHKHPHMFTKTSGVDSKRGPGGWASTHPGSVFVKSFQHSSTPILESTGPYLGVLLCQLAVLRLQVCNVGHCCWQPDLPGDGWCFGLVSPVVGLLVVQLA